MATDPPTFDNARRRLDALLEHMNGLISELQEEVVRRTDRASEGGGDGAGSDSSGAGPDPRG